ncbi:MAG TPA: EthD family reductase [Ktedonobacteraceae bacterium]|nr:EthD family reductase [Ktedonobacteraceae bacterium]
MAHSQDPDAFDRHYREVHAPLARKFPGLKGYTAYKPASLNPQERSPYYLIADLYFDSPEAFSAALNSPEGQAAAADLQNFATAGVTLLAGEVQVYDPISIG